MPIQGLRAFGLAACATIVSSVASAADLPARTAPPPPPLVQPLPIFSWTGFYVGLNAGAAFGGGVSNINAYGFTSRSAAAADYINNNSGNNTVFTGGLYAGYNYQISSLVLGAEGDINYLGDIRKKNSGTLVATGAGLAPAGTYMFDTGRTSNFYGTIRGRVGLAVDRFLVFGTGGLAFAGNGGSGTGTVIYTSPAGASTALTGSGSDASHVGYAVGGGVEYAMTNAVVVRAEYLYVNLGNSDRTFTSPSGASYSIANNVRESFSVARAGISYKF